MSADSLEELHTFAYKLGLRRSWFQPGRTLFRAHYDLTPNKRAQALSLGAIALSTPEMFKKLGKVVIGSEGTGGHP